MRSRPRSGVRRVRNVLTVSSAAVLGLGLLAAPATAAPNESLPALPSLMDIPGASQQLTGGKDVNVAGDGRTNINLPLVPQGGVRKQFANAPAVEQSTKPACAPFVFVGVPGTFEINRDDPSNKPTGMLSKITDPLTKQLGNKFVPTMINYDADAGVNGTSYKTSVDRGVKKTLATVTDVANRCPKASIIIAGYSQGADVAGTTATAIGQKRTPVNPDRIGGVVLVSDPARTPNSNVIADTNQNRPDIPAFLANIVGQLTSDPSFAQLQMTAGGVDSLLSGGGLDALTGIAKSLAGGDDSTSPGAAGSTAGADPTDSTAGADPTDSSGVAGATKAPASTSVPFSADDPSVTPDSPTTSLNPDAPTKPGLAGSNYVPGTATIKPVDGPEQQLAKASDELKPVKTGDRGEMPEGISSIGNKDGEWIPVGGNTSQGVLAEKAKSGGWYYGRTAEQKDVRRKVVDDLFVNGWEQCKGKTLTECRGAYVDGLPDGQKAPGILLPSSELTSTRDALVKKNPSYQRPTDKVLNTCLDVASEVCSKRIDMRSDRTEDFSGKSGFPDPTKSDHTRAENRRGAEILAAVTGYRDENNADRPISDILNMKDQILPGSESSKCTIDEDSTLFKDVKKASPNEEVSDDTKRLVTAWRYKNRMFPGKTYVDLSKSDEEIAESIKKLIPDSDQDFRKCMAWSGAVWRKVDSLYGSGMLTYREGYKAPNDAVSQGDSNDRESFIKTLYQYGGCGAPKTGHVADTVAPNGEWGRQGCSTYHSADKKGDRANLTNGELKLLSGNAKKAYEEAKPDWRADLVEPDKGNDDAVFTVADGKFALSCATLSARACAITHTKIKGPEGAAPPAGVTKMIKPIYPSAKSHAAKIDWGQDTAAEQVEPGDTVEAKLKDGYLWATTEVVDAVGRLDDIRLDALGKSKHATQPDGVNTMIEVSTGKEEKVTSDAVERLNRGWVWARTKKENDQRDKIVGDLYSYYGCEDQTYGECRNTYMKAGLPEYALSNKDVTDKVNQAKDNLEQKRLPGIVYDPEKLPVDLKECEKQSVVKCAGGEEAPATPTTGADTPAGGDEGDPTGTDEPESPDDETGAPESGSSGGGNPVAPNTGGGSSSGGSGPATTNAGSGSSGTTSTPSTSSSGTTSTPSTSSSRSSTNSSATAGADPTSSAARSGDDSGSSSGSTAGGGSTATLAGTDPDADGGLANGLTNLITGGSSAGTSNGGSGGSPVGSTPGEKANVTPITQKAVAGGGLAGKRDADFGALKGRVVSLCVPGDIVCSLPEDSELAQDLVKFAKNLSVNFPDMASDEGATRMGGLLALQGLNTVADITGMPQTKLSADTLQALMNIAAGGAMLAAQQPAGSALVADGVSKLPDAMPELFAQLRDVPELLRKLPDAPQNAADNTGLDKYLGRVTAAFEDAGMTSPLDVQKYPDAATSMMQGLVEDNTGLVKMVTDPQYWKANAHVLYPSLKVAGDMGSLNWVSQWFTSLAKAAGLR